MVLDISSLYLNMDSRGGTYSRDLSAERRNATRFYSRPSQFFLSLYDRCGCYRIAFTSPTVDFSYTAMNTSFQSLRTVGSYFGLTSQFATVSHCSTARCAARGRQEFAASYSDAVHLTSL